jgi:hypothetical protein
VEVEVGVGGVIPPAPDLTEVEVVVVDLSIEFNILALRALDMQ